MERIAGKYDVIKTLGRGITGYVYLVRHVDLGVEYALKLLNDSLSDDASFIARFKQEAEILLRFSHPGSVQLRDFGRTIDGRYYLSMDYCDGVLLTDFLEAKGRLDVLTTLNILEQLLDVLSGAHALGIVHRDIKPENIVILDSEGETPRVKILDFGIGTLREKLGVITEESEERIVIGTPEYMAPEQVSADVALDHRVDIYSAGIVFYELLTGSVPFIGESVAHTLLMHLIHPLEPMDPEFNIPFLIEGTIAKALKKERDERYQTADEFLEAVREGRELLGCDKIDLRFENLEANEKENDGDSSGETGSETAILCLDDDEMVLNIMSHILEREGYKVYTEQSYSGIHDYLFKKKVHLLISDVQMPGLTGGKVCEMIKKTVGDIKVVLFSNIDERELAKIGSESKADGWISKNQKPEEWLKDIQEILDG